MKRKRSIPAGLAGNEAGANGATKPSASAIGARELRQFKLSTEQLQRHLDGSFRKLFREITGLQLHLVWHQPFDTHKTAGKLRLCPRVGNVGDGNGGDRPVCGACLEKNWAPGDTFPNVGQRFVGQCGLSTFRAAIATDGSSPPLMLAVQASVGKRRHNGDRSISVEEFEKAITLLRFIKRDLEMILRAETAELTLAGLRRRLPVLQKEARLVEALSRQADPTAAVIGSQRGEHKQRIVHRMVAYVHEHFHHPMTLTQVATELGMNAAYLSDLFSTQLGMTFRDYLLEVRMARARQFLLTPHRRINEVACAVGYSSADQFRHAFKAHAGVSPSEWR